jgi:hypothetical protein
MARAALFSIALLVCLTCLLAGPPLPELAKSGGPLLGDVPPGDVEGEPSVTPPLLHTVQTPEPLDLEHETVHDDSLPDGPMEGAWEELQLPPAGAAQGDHA